MNTCCLCNLSIFKSVHKLTRDFAGLICINNVCVFLFEQVIAAEGEMNASRALKEAANVMSESPSALQLRYMQTLTEIASEKNSTVVFPVPVDLISHFMRR